MNTESFRPPFWKLFFLSTLPVAAALVTGFWLSGRIHERSAGEPRAEVERLRTEEVIAQDRLLVDSLWGAIETVKARALSLLSVRQAQKASGAPLATLSQPEGTLLHWAELEVREGGRRLLRQVARNAAFAPGQGWETFESFYLKAAMERLSLKELEENGVSVLRIKRDPNLAQEWMALAFAGHSAGSVVLTLVDPVEVFPIFRRWTQRSEGGNLRGYLIGSDGYVLAHSQKPHVSSDFSRTQVFQQGVRRLLQGGSAAKSSGSGVFVGIDQVPVTAAFARPGTLPLSVVVERAAPPVAAQSALARVALAVARHAPGAARALVIGLALSAAFAALLGRLMRRAAEASPATAATGWEQPPAHAPAGDGQALSIQEVSPELWDGGDAPDVAPGIHAAPDAPGMAKADSQAVEMQVFDELLSARASEPRAVAERAERLLRAQFDEAVKARDPRVASQRLADVAARATGGRVLVFRYHKALRSAILQAYAGFEGSTWPGSLSFALSDAMLARIARYHRDGRTASLSDDPALSLLLARRLGASRYEAWPVIHGDGSILGVMAVLQAVAGPELPLKGLENAMRLTAAPGLPS